MERTKKRLGLIGTGSVVKRFVDGLEQAKRQAKINVEITAVADVKRPIDTEPLRKGTYEYYPLPLLWAENPNANAMPQEMKDFLEAVDAVYVASPNNTHKGYILCALEGGKDILCTKPLAESFVSSRSLKNKLLNRFPKASYETGDPGNPKFMYEDHYLYQDICIKLFGGALKSNPFDVDTLGEIQSVKAFFIEKAGASRIEPKRADWLFAPEKSGGGVWTDIGIHLVRILHKLGAEFEIISACPSIDAGFEAEMKMTVHARLNLDPEVRNPLINWSETPVYLVAEKEADHAWKEINLYFEKGLVSLDFVKGRILRFTESQGWETLLDSPSTAFRNIAEIFYELITGQADKRLAGLCDAVRDMEVIGRAYRKAALKNEEEIWLGSRFPYFG